MKKYEPELGQALFGNPTGEYSCPDYVEALISHLIREMRRVYWNKTQIDFDDIHEAVLSKMEWRPYFWGDENCPIREKPNFSFENVELRWYKHFGRGMSLNTQKTPLEWINWFTSGLEYLEKLDDEIQDKQDYLVSDKGGLSKK